MDDDLDRPRKLVLTWRNEFMPELVAEGHSRLTYTLEPGEPLVETRGFGA